MLSDDKTSGGEYLLVSEESESNTSDVDESDTVNNSDEWRGNFGSNSIPLFKGHASGAAKILDETKVEQDFPKCFFPDELFEFTARETDRYGFAKYHPSLSDMGEKYQ